MLSSLSNPASLRLKSISYVKFFFFCPSLTNSFKFDERSVRREDNKKAQGSLNVDLLWDFSLKKGSCDREGAFE